MAHVDGYVRSYLSSAFVFPIGDNGKYRPVAIASASTTQPVDAAYYGVDPSSAVTSSIKGGNEPVLPSTGPFSIAARSSSLNAVSNVEYWDINGAGATQITLTWNANSAINTLVAANLNRLTIAGWNGTEWVSIASTVDATALSGGASTLSVGSITTSSAIVPNTYQVYTLASLEVNNTATLNVKVLLQGALFTSSTPGVMSDDLRTGGYIPLSDPYSNSGNSRFAHAGAGAAATTTNAVLNAATPTSDAIVDWVFVELRNATNPTIIIETRVALLQRDGDVVNPTDGISPLIFPGLDGQSFYVSIKHRNHLGAMTAAPIAMTHSGVTVDFTTMTNADLFNKTGYDGAEMVTVGSVKALWAGNANADTKVKYQGTNNDNAIILGQVLSHLSNTTQNYNFDLGFGYWSGDLNMDGKVKYQGTGNDPVYLFVNLVTNYSLNTLDLYNFDVFVEQIP